jgi:hypothetical protein
MGKHAYVPTVLVCTLSTRVEDNQRTQQEYLKQKLLPGIR